MVHPPAPAGRISTQGRAGGFTDWLPGASERRRAIADAFLDTFRSWGYGLVGTPLVEPVDTVAAGVDSRRQAQLFRFMDSDGSLLALVGERTVSVARVVATQLHRGPFPLRLCYAGSVLRNRPLLGGRRRETMQAGCELIGHRGLEADAECVAVAAAAVDRAGLTDVQIDVGHADFIPGLLAGAGIEEATQHLLLDALSSRDLVAVEAALDGTPMGEAERELLLSFPTLRGGPGMLETAGERLVPGRARAALEELATLWDLLVEHGLQGRIHLDLGAVPDWGYYTGPIFELFSGELGFPIGTGGRYDSLLGRLGAPMPATGFVLHVDRCTDVALAGRPASPPPVVMVTHGAGARAQAVSVAVEIRAGGRNVRCALDESDPDTDIDGLHVTGGGAARWCIDGTQRSGSVGDAVSAILGAR